MLPCSENGHGRYHIANVEMQTARKPSDYQKSLILHTHAGMGIFAGRLLCEGSMLAFTTGFL